MISHIFYLIVETLTGVSYDFPQNTFCHVRVIHLNLERSLFRFIFFGDNSRYSCRHVPPLRHSNNIFCTAPQHFFWFFRFYAEDGLYFSFDLLKYLSARDFSEGPLARVLDGSFIQYMQIFRVADPTSGVHTGY